MHNLTSLTMTQLERLYRHVWERMTRGDGYQPFGYDSVTLWAVHPGFMEVIQAIKTEAKRRKELT